RRGEGGSEELDPTAAGSGASRNARSSCIRSRAARCAALYSAIAFGASACCSARRLRRAIRLACRVSFGGYLGMWKKRVRAEKVPLRNGLPSRSVLALDHPAKTARPISARSSVVALRRRRNRQTDVAHRQ